MLRKHGDLPNQILTMKEISVHISFYVFYDLCMYINCLWYVKKTFPSFKIQKASHIIYDGNIFCKVILC